MSQIITFYSYKGGVGRSMALANVATLLSKWGKKVLMIDWDLEAPGLENFFKDFTKDVDWAKQKGVLEWLYAQQNKESFHWEKWTIPIKTSISKTELHLLPSGKANGNYAEMLRDFDVAKFYTEHDGGHAIERFREELLSAYDYILIDSRTGVTDFGGICTIQLPDILVMLFTPTEQSLMGTKKIAQRILDNHGLLPFDRFRLLISPIPSKFDSTTEFQESRKWLDRFSAELLWLYEEWLPSQSNLNELLQILKIPYISYFSFGEKLPVIEQGVNDPAGLGYAYENLAMLLSKQLDGVDLFMENRDSYLREASGQESQVEQNPNLKDSRLRVRIYISCRKEEYEFRDALLKMISTQFPANSIEFIDKSGILLGQSIRNFFLEKISISDIILLLIGQNYFIRQEEASREVNQEYNAIQDSSKEVTVPVFLYQNSLNKNIPNFILDRQGINVSSLNSEEAKIDYIVKSLKPTIEALLEKKIRPSHIAI